MKQVQLLFFMFCMQGLLAQTPKQLTTQIPQTPQLSYKFIQNRNQWDNHILFKAQIPNGALFVKANSVVYSFLDPEATAHHHDHAHAKHESEENHAEEKIKGHGVAVEFVGASETPTITTAGEGEENYNYFIGNDPSKWASNLKGYEQLDFKDLYEGINMRYFTKDNTLKYEFIVAPAANPQQIQLRYKGATNLHIDKEGNLQIGTSILNFTEHKPYSYQMIDGKKVEIASKFVLRDSIVSFELGKYDNNYELVIDPELIFCSYSGSNTDNYGMTATFDSDGNLYAGGIAFGQNVPPTTGAFDVTFGGSIDILLLKFNSSGTNLLYATFLGGENEDNPNSIVVNPDGNLIVLGNTNSQGFPSTANAYDRDFNGNIDITLSILNSTGSQLLASTFVGGTGADGRDINIAPNYGDGLRGEVDIDNIGNIYIASVTTSSNFPIVNAGIGSSFSGNSDGVAMKFSSNLSTLLWSTFIGGAGNDIAYSIDVMSNNNVVVAGSTGSINFQTTPTAVQTTFRGNRDGYVRLYSSSGVLLGSTFIGAVGTTVLDHLYMMDIDTENNIYVFGYSNGNHPISAGTYNVPNGANFMYKLNPFLTRILWSTRIGARSGATANSQFMSPTAFMISNCGTIFLSGWGDNLSNYPTTTGALYPTAPPNTFYLAMYGKDCRSLEYATFFGGTSGFNHVDGGTSRFARDGTVYQSMCIGNNTLPTTPNAWRPSKGLGSWNNAVFKMNINPLKADFIIVDAITEIPVPEPIICFPTTIKLKNRSIGGTTYLWDLGVLGTSTAFEPVVTLTQEGTYPFKLTINNTFCEAVATRSAVVTSTPAITPNTTICVGQTTQLQAVGGISYRWTPTIGLNNPNIANPIASPTVTTTYTVTITGNGCTRQREVTVLVQPAASVNFNTSVNPCTGQVTFTNTSATGGTYLWDFGNGQTSTTQNPSPITYTNGTYIVRLTVTTPTSCPTTISRIVAISSFSPTVSAFSQNICVGSSTTLSASGGASYSWSPATGLNTTTGAFVTARPTQTTTYTVRVANATCVKDTSITVIVRQKTPANFSVALENDACVSYPLVRITNLTPNLPDYTYSWTITGQPSRTTRDIAPFRPTSAGTINIFLTVRSSSLSACDSIITRSVVIPAPIPNTLIPNVSSSTTICTPNQTVFLFASGGNSYNWTPTTGLSNPNIANPSANVAQTTTYTVRIRNTVSGCFKDTTVTINVSPTVLANFTATTTPDCEVMPLVSINNTSVHVPNTTYLWDFGNGQTSTLQNPPPFKYTTAGNYTIRLTTNNGTSCNHFSTRNITITNNNSGINAVVPPNYSICQGEDAQLTASGGTTYSWSPTTGLSNPTIANPIATPTTTTNYTVRISNATGCFVDKNVTVAVNPNTIPNFDVVSTGGCGGALQLVVNNTSSNTTGADYLWDFDNGQTSTLQNPPPITYSTAGSYVVTLYTNLTSACPQSISRTVNITAGGTLTTTISPTQRTCAGNSVQLQATGGTTYTWTPTAGLNNANIANPIANPSVTTTYSVVISNGSCQKTETVTVEVNEKPTANFAKSLSEPCATMPLVTLTNNSSTTLGTTYLWDFGNGQTSTDPTPAPFRYAVAGTYTITLTVKNANGCEQTTSQNITITAGTPIVSTISPTQRTCAGNSVQLQATGGTTYTWTPTTGLNNANIANPIANPSVTTIYSVVISNGSCQKIETVTVEVNERPTAAFNHVFAEPCATMPLVTLTNNSSTTLGTTYLWDFGNGQTSTDPTPAPFRYAVAGTYTITLTVRNTNGCENTIVKSIIIAPNPILNAKAIDNQVICTGGNVQLSASGGTVYSWTPATGLDNPTIANPIASPSATTTYTVRISNNLGCFKDIPVTVGVETLPTARFTLQQSDACSTFPLITLKNESINATSFWWDFGNGTSSTANNPAIRYTNEGNYTIRLYAYNGQSCSSSAEKTVQIRRNAVIYATVQPIKAICRGESVQLQASGGIQYQWSPIEGLNNPTIANPIASPSQTTTYNVRIFNQFNCSKDTSITVNVVPAVTADFQVFLRDSCSRFPTVSIQNLSTLATNLTYSWDFGNGQGSNLAQPPSFSYNAAGTYTITLTVNNGVCSRTKTYQLVYKENPDFDFYTRLTVSPTQNLCAGEKVQLQATGGTSYSWTPTTGLNNPLISNPLASPTVTTRYHVRISNALGCYRDTSVLVNVYPPIQADFGVLLEESCDQEYPLVKLTPTLLNGTVYQWDLGNGQTYIGENPPAFRYATAGLFTIRLKAMNQACSREVVRTVKIEKNDINFYKNITLKPEKPTICQNASIQLEANGGVKYVWTPIVGLSNPNIANPIANPTATTRYSVRIFNAKGCFRDTAILVTVAPDIKPDFEVQITSECGSSAKVSFVNKTTGTGEYKWKLGNGEEFTTANISSYEYPVSGEYEVILEVFNGVCRKTKTQRIQVENVKPPNVITPNGDGKNERFVIDKLREGWKIEIYDRYGNTKFKSDNYQNDWGDVDVATYFYLITSPEGKTCKGWVQVLKD